MGSEMKRLILATAFAVTALASAHAQSYPSRPVTVIVPYPAGGPTDQVTRQIAPKMAAKLGQNFVVENVSGGGTNIAGQRVARSAPDGYTLFVHNLQISANVSLYKSLPFDTEKDFRPVSLVASLPQLFAVNPATPYQTFAELMAYVKQNPGKLDYASVGIGSPSHMAGELLKMRLDAYMVHIPYRGGGPAVAATMAGDVPLLIVSIPAAMGQVRAGRLRPLAVSTKQRTPILPNVPTIAEATGLKDYEVDSWYAVFAPAKTPDEVVARMQKEIATIAVRPDVSAKLLEQGAVGVSSTPEELGRIVKREMNEWRDVVKRANIVGE